MDDDAIRTVVMRLSRPHKSGGESIDRSAILAEADSAAVLAWITAHDGQPEARPPAAESRGLHSARLNARAAAAPANPRRYILPPGALS